MVYRVGTVKDFAQIKELVDTTGYYNPIFPENMGGHWIVAEHDGQVHACVWSMIEAPNAYLDYWVGKGITALKLLGKLEAGLTQIGVTLVRGMIHESNTSALKMVCSAPLNAYGATGYAIIAKELLDGNPKDNDD